MEKTVLLVDVGNSFVKYCIHEKVDVQPLQSFDVLKLPSADLVCIASVVENESLLHTFYTHFNQVVRVHTQRQHGNLINGYTDFSQLGVDRWLALVAVYEMYPQQTVFIVDIGSAVTFDLLTAEGQHRGGWIMPGLDWLKKTHLPFVSRHVHNSSMLATNTAQAWHNGCRLMVIDAINARIAELYQTYADMQVVLTGGGIHTLQIADQDLTFSCSREENLVLSGLNIWHNHYVRHQ